MQKRVNTAQLPPTYHLMSNRIYPNSTPEFRVFQKQDGTMEMQVRYRNDAVGYCSQWQPMAVEKEEIKND